MCLQTLHSSIVVGLAIAATAVPSSAGSPGVFRPTSSAQVDIDDTARVVLLLPPVEGQAGALFSVARGLVDQQFDVVRSVDNGVAWKIQSSGPMHWRISALAFIGGELYAGTRRHGLYRSPDNGVTWVREDIPILDIKSLAELPGGRVAAGTDTGIWARDPKAGWHRLDRGLGSVSAVAVDPAGHILIESGWRIYRSRNGGETF